MTRSEIGKILAIIQAVLPNVEVKNIRATGDAWHFLIGDIDYRLAETALKAVLSSQKIPAWPTPGAIRQAALDLSCRIPSEDEVMQEILDRLHYHHREHPPLSAIAAKVSSALGWDYMGGSEEPGVLRGQIRGLYKSCLERVKQDMIMIQIGDGKKIQGLVGNQDRMKKLTAGIGKITGREQ